MSSIQYFPQGTVSGSVLAWIGTDNVIWAAPPFPLNVGILSFIRTTLTLANGDNNNVVIPGNNVFNKISGPTADFAMTGITALADGSLLKLLNRTGFNMTIKHESASSAAANRIVTMTGADVVSVGDCAYELIYDTS